MVTTASPAVLQVKTNFLSPRLPPHISASVVDVTLVDPEAYARGHPSEAAASQDVRPPPGEPPALATLPLGTTVHEASRLLRRSGADRAAILRLPHARGLLCGIGGGSAQPTTDFNQLARRVLRAPPWCTRCDRGCKQLLERWLAPEQIGRPRGYGEWCLQTPSPKEFRYGECTLNTVGSWSPDGSKHTWTSGGHYRCA